MKPAALDRAAAMPLSSPFDCPAPLAQALAAELVDLTRLLADLAFDLASHPDTLRRHMHSLQAIDLLTQTQLAIADTLRAEASVADRIAAITLQELADSLRARIDDPAVPGDLYSSIEDR